MKVHVQFYAQLRDAAGKSESDIEIEPDRTIADLLEQLYRELPALRAHDKGILIGAGLEFVNRNYRLKPDETISIMPPVQGG
ncbi:MAG TPA: MoaD/ThiS family protein [Chthoniobacterales bacterium]